MQRTVVWSPLRWPGSEHMEIRDDAEGITVDGMVIVAEGGPLRVHYRLLLDRGWVTRRLAVAVHGGPVVSLERASDGLWSDEDGPRPDLEGCIDVDLSVTPFTNTLPIRRLSLAPGESADLRMVYVLVGPSVEVTAADQRYTHLDADAAGARYRYESGDFRADLDVDADGLVVEYPGLWHMELASARTQPTG